MSQGTEAAPDAGPDLIPPTPIDPLDHVGLVKTIALGYRDRGLDLDDLIQEGHIGLLSAVKVFDPSRGASFSTVAGWYIKQAISRALKSNPNPIRIPESVYANMIAIRDGTVTVEQLTEGQRECMERAEHVLGLSIYTGQAVLGQCGDRQSCGPSIEDVNLAHLLLDRLAGREREVVASYHGIGGDHSETFPEIAERLGVSRQRVTTVYYQAVERLRRYAIGDLSRSPKPAAVTAS